MLDAAKAVVEDMKYSGILEALMEGHPVAKKRNRPQPGRRRGGIVHNLGRSLTSRGSRGSRDPSPAASPDTSRAASPSGPWDARRGGSPRESSDSEEESRDASPVRVNVGTADGTTAHEVGLPASFVRYCTGGLENHKLNRAFSGHRHNGFSCASVGSPEFICLWVTQCLSNGSFPRSCLYAHAVCACSDCA